MRRFAGILNTLALSLTLFHSELGFFGFVDENETFHEAVFNSRIYIQFNVYLITDIIANAAENPF